MVNETRENGSPYEGVQALARGATRRQGRECLSDLQLDQLALGELGGVEGDRARLHLTQCVHCEAAQARLEAERGRFAQEVNVGAVTARLLQPRALAPTPLRRWARALAWPTAVSAAAALGLIFVAAPLTTSGPSGGAAPASGTRTKGAALSLATYVRFAGQDQPGTLHLGQPLGEGDRLAFRVSTNEPGHLAILAVDGKGEVSVFYPPGPQTAPLQAGKDQALETAVELDATPGEETVIALLCETPRPVAALVDATRRAAGQTGRAPLTGPLLEDCAEARTTLVKRGPGPTADP